jgi:hypothetical protein
MTLGDPKNQLTLLRIAPPTPHLHNFNMLTITVNNYHRSEGLEIEEYMSKNRTD